MELARIVPVLKQDGGVIGTTRRKSGVINIIRWISPGLRISMVMRIGLRPTNRFSSSMAKAIGQPCFLTHPHLMSIEEVTPGISRDEYTARRSAFTSMLPTNSVAIIPAYRTQYSSLNILYKSSASALEQNNNLLYLTGFAEPDAVLAVEKTTSGNETKFIMFVEDNDKNSLLWSGPKNGLEGTKSHFGFQAVYRRQNFGQYLREMTASRVENVFVDFEDNDCLTADHEALLRDAKTAIKPIKNILHRLRLIKSPAEQALMREASLVGGESFRETMRWSKGQRQEGNLAAHIEYEARLRGASGLAYVPVVAGGDRANIIHYVRNDRIITEGTMVLMDAGAKKHGYCNDITRTWPISGRFSDAQRLLYEAVLRVQKHCITAASRWRDFPDLSINALNQVANVLFVEELRLLGFRNSERAVAKLFPHSIGHWLGMDLHDCPTVSCDEPFKEGMVITIEPGLYVPASEEYPTHFHGIGVRIEDDVLLTADGVLNLTETVPRDPEEIESLLNS